MKETWGLGSWAQGGSYVQVRSNDGRGLGMIDADGRWTLYGVGAHQATIAHRVASMSVSRLLTPPFKSHHITTFTAFVPASSIITPTAMPVG